MKAVQLAFVALAGVLAMGIAHAQSQEVKLASVDVGRLVTDKSPETVRMRQAIAKLRSVCPKENASFPDRVAQVTRERLTNEGKLTYSVEVFEAIQAVVNDYVGEDCTAVFAQYVTARNKAGFNHAEAVTAIRSIMVAAHSIGKK